MTQAEFEILVFLARKHQLPYAEVRQRHKEFSMLDFDADGRLTIQEFEETVRIMCNLPRGAPLPKHVVKHHWVSVDVNAKGTIDFEEFLLWATQTAYTEEVLVPDPSERRLRKMAKENGLYISDVERVKVVFDRYDSDGSDRIDESEFKNVLCTLMKVKDPSDISDTKLHRYWREVDLDCSGEVNFEEFLNWYIKHF